MSPHVVSHWEPENPVQSPLPAEEGGRDETCSRREPLPELLLEGSRSDFYTFMVRNEDSGPGSGSRKSRTKIKLVLEYDSHDASGR